MESKPSSSPQDEMLRDAARLIRAGHKEEARQLLSKIINIDSNNVAAWELMTGACYNAEEEIECLENILKIQPQHARAKQALETLLEKRYPASQLSQNANPVALQSNPTVNAPKPPSPRVNQSHTNQPKKERESRSSSTIIVVGLLAIVCLLAVTVALYRPGYFSASPTNSPNPTTSLDCQTLINQAMEASGDYCGQIGSNTVCYGNITLSAQLIPGVAGSFSQRGDMIGVENLYRLSASPLDLNNREWGIAIFKVLANLPRSLPGENVTMVVFGNTTLDSPTGGLQTFFFSSKPGQIVCEEVPFDGIMINAPEGTGIQFKVNGAEVILMGNASMQATANGSMQIALYSGSGRIIANGQEQYFGAGQQVSVSLGGPGGIVAVGPPTAPKPISPSSLIAACTITREYCSTTIIPTIGLNTAIAGIQAGLGTMPAGTPSRTAIPKTPPATIGTRTENPTNQQPTINPSLPTVTTQPQPTATTQPQPTATTMPQPTATTKPQPTTKPQTIEICHWQNGLYIQLTVNVNALGKTGHEGHPQDIIPMPPGGCP